MASTRGLRTLRLVVPPAVLAVALAAWFGPFEVSGSIKVDGKLFAASSWTLERSGQGTLTAVHRERDSGVTRSYAVQSVDRGDVAVLEMENAVRIGRRVARGDTIAVLRSAESDARLAELEGERSIAEREAAAVSAGEKETLVEETRARLEQARDLVTVQERIVTRIQTLADQSLASAAELDKAQSELVARRGEVDVITAEIAVLESGARPEDRRVASARLEAARSRLEAMLRSRSLLVVRSPIAGVVTRSPSDSVLVAVSDTTRWVVAVALPEEQRSRVHPGQAAVVAARDLEAGASVIDVNPSVQLLAGKHVVLTTLMLDEPLSGAIEGLRVLVQLEVEPQTVSQWMSEKARVLFQWETWFTNRKRG